MINRDVKAFVLRALLAKNGAFPEETLKDSIRSAFPNVAFTDGDLKQWIRELQNSQLIAGTNDDISGVMWDLTVTGKIRAQQLL
jgi:hypothetical protein